MHMHPLLFLGCFVVIVPVIYFLIGIIIVLMRPTAKAQRNVTGIDPWLLAWIDGEGTRVIQLAMFSLLNKKYLWSPEAVLVLANGRYASCEMNVIERALFDHFEVRKPCHEDLPSNLSIARVNIWQEHMHNAGLALSSLRRWGNLLMIGLPSIAIGAILACKALIYHNLADNIFSWLLMLIGCMLWLPLWIDTIWDQNRLDFNGISHNDAHACIDALRAELTRNGDEMDDAAAMFYVAVNGVDSLPEHYREYKELIGPISDITSLRTED